MADKLYVCSSVSKMCFYVDTKTLEPLGCSTYDPWCVKQPEEGQIFIEEWNRRRAALAEERGEQ